MEKTQLRQVIADHQERFSVKEAELVERDVGLDYYLKGTEIIVISGIRRCGKSTLLKLIAHQLHAKNKMFVDFDDIRLTGFSVDNFTDIEDIAFERFGTPDVLYFFDEIQNAPHWERWVNNLFSAGRKVFLTGSNSRLLSSEISTYLTGRNKVLHLMPFSFREYLRLQGIDLNEAGMQDAAGQKTVLTSDQEREINYHFVRYFELGGFPLIIRNDDVELSRQYFEDILNKDILARYNIRHAKEMKDLSVFLFSNPGRTYSFATLKKLTGIKSLSTLKNYVDYLEEVFLLHTIHRFDYSVAKQRISSAKPYVADASFFRTISFNFSENRGTRLENLVFLELVRRGKEVFYHHSEKSECDFIVREGLVVTGAIQVSYDMTHPKTRTREIDGLKSAMKRYGLQEGLILTFEESGRIEEQGITIQPISEWLLWNAPL